MNNREYIIQARDLIWENGLDFYIKLSKEKIPQNAIYVLIMYLDFYNPKLKDFTKCNIFVENKIFLKHHYITKPYDRIM